MKQKHQTPKSAENSVTPKCGNTVMWQQAGREMYEQTHLCPDPLWSAWTGPETSGSGGTGGSRKAPESEKTFCPQILTHRLDRDATLLKRHNIKTYID